MQPDLALARQARVTRIGDRAAARAAILWRKRMRGDFDLGWAALGDDVTGITQQGQILAASGATAYLSATAHADGLRGGAGAVQADAFAGVDASGRSLSGLLYGSVTTAKSLVGAGSGVQAALSAGSVYLQTMVRTAVADTGRSADLTAMTSHRYTLWVRVISPGACSRCAMLAGTASAKTPFQRHPGCRCTSAPQTSEGKTLTASSRFASPTAYFESMTVGEQDRIFTRAGAAAIRAGADPVSVVSARRGARGIAYSSAVVDGKTLPHSGRRLERAIIGHRPDGTPILGYLTGEGTTARGAYMQRQRIVGAGRQQGTRFRADRRVRLMPETIVGLTDDVALRTVLLRDAGYLDVPITSTDRTTADWMHRRADVIRADRATADAFYRSHGIALG